MQFSDSIWWRHNKSKMADWRHIENRFLAISRRHIGRSTRNLEQKWKITCRYRSRDQNCNFRKFKVADGRHFENSFLYISRELTDFDQNMVHRYKFPFRACKFGKKSKFFKFKVADGRHIENRSTRNSERRWRITCQYRSRDQNCNFQNSRWRTAAILKTVFGVYVILVMN